MTQLVLFDYVALDPETRIVVQQEDKEFDQNMTDAGASFIRACHNLKRIHERLRYSHPGFVDYCNAKPGLGKSTAYKMIGAAKMFPEYGNISIASREAIYMLAAPSTPDEVREEALERAANGETITPFVVQTISTNGNGKHIDTETGEIMLPDALRDLVALGDVAPNYARRVAKRIEREPEAVRDLLASDPPADMEAVEGVIRAYHKQLDTFRVIEKTKALDGQIPLRSMTGRDLDYHLEQARAEHLEQARAEKRHQRAREIAVIAERSRAIDPAGLGQFPVILADPPWHYEHVETESRAIENHYPTMGLRDICLMPVSKLATDDAVLFLWTTSPKLAEAIQAIAMWGFVYRTAAAWVKDKIGMGYYFRQRHEHLLVATRGTLPVPLPENRPDSVIEYPRGRHSEKPVTAYEHIEAMYPEYRKIELFSRAPRAGWCGWGNEYGTA